jgi:hypothetical protein
MSTTTELAQRPADMELRIILALEQHSLPFSVSCYVPKGIVA